MIEFSNLIHQKIVSEHPLYVCIAGKEGKGEGIRGEIIRRQRSKLNEIKEKKNFGNESKEPFCPLQFAVITSFLLKIQNSSSEGIVHV